MSDLPAGLARCPAELSRVPARGAGVVLNVVVVALLAVVIVPVMIVLPVPRLRVPLAVVVGLATYLALAGSGAAHVFLLGAAVSGLATGRGVLSVLERRRWWQRRLTRPAPWSSSRAMTGARGAR